MKRIRNLILIFLISGWTACDGDGFEVITVDLSKTQIDLLFVSESEGIPQVYAVMDTSFEPIINVVSGLAFGAFGTVDPTWSTDGRKFAFTDYQLLQGGRITHSNIYIRNMDSTRSLSTALRRVTYSPVIVDTLGNVTAALNLRPDWHSDTERLVFISNRDSVFKVYLVTVDNDSLAGDTLPQSLTDETIAIDVNCYPSFSPDGQKIIYTRKNGATEEIWSMNLSGGNQTPLVVNGASINSRPRYSPAGDKIAFYSTLWKNNFDSLQVYTVNADGSGLDTITTSGNNYDPAWSPDGSQMVFAVRTLSGRGYIYIMNADGSGQRKLISDRASYYPIWRP